MARFIKQLLLHSSFVCIRPLNLFVFQPKRIIINLIDLSKYICFNQIIVVVIITIKTIIIMGYLTPSDFAILEDSGYTQVMGLQN